MNKIRLGSDNFIQLNGPVRVDTSIAASNGGTCTARLYDERKETRVSTYRTRLTADIAASGVLAKIPKTNPVVPFLLDKIRIVLDDGAIHEQWIGGASSANVGWNELTISAIASAASAGNLVEVLAHGSAQTILSVETTSKLVVGDQVEILLASGATKITTVTQVQEIVATEDTYNVLATAAANQGAGLSISTAATFGSNVNAGARIRCKLGADVAMAAFYQSGSAFPTTNVVAGDSTWGFRGTIPDTHDDLVVGQDVRIEITYDGGAGLLLVDSIRAKVVEQDA